MSATPTEKGLTRSASMRIKRRNSKRPSITTNLFAVPSSPTKDEPSQRTPSRAVSPSQVLMDSRTRSDSALASLRRRQTVGVLESADDAGDGFSTAPQSPASLKRPSRHQRLSLGLTTLGPKFGLHHKRPDGFFDVFGLLGVPMIVFFGCTSIAVLCQAYIQVYPIAFANYLMNTGSFDDGEFWMLPDNELLPTIVATTLLIVFAACYVYLAMLMVFFRSKAIMKKQTKPQISQATINTAVEPSPVNHRLGSRSMSARFKVKPRFPELNGTQLLRLMIPMMLRPSMAGRQVVTLPTKPDPPPSRSNSFRNDVVPVGTPPPTSSSDPIKKKELKDKTTSIPLQDIYQQFVRPDGVYNSYYNVLYDTPKLVLQSITLLAYLRKGFPIALTAFYASLLTFNYLISFYRFQRKRIDHALVVTRLFYLFDLFFAAFAPIVVLVFAFYSFHFDRDVFATKTETMVPGLFDRNARLYADPYETSIFRLSFGSLRLSTFSVVFPKCSLLFLSIFKWHKIIVYLINRNRMKQLQMTAHLPKNRKHSRSRRHLVFGVVLFIFFGSGIVLYTAGSIATSLRHCEQYKDHCVVVSYHWTFPDESCPCLVYINRKTDPRSFDEWQHPPDASEELDALAAMGELKVIQIINRALPTLPENVRKCKKLEQVILIYSKTEVIPPWGKELEYLQYLHIEGDFTSNLRVVPLDLFSKMKHLQYLHTGVVPRLSQYPDLSSLSRLKTLVIASPHSLTELPNLDGLGNLRVLMLVEVSHISRLPSLQKLKKLRALELFYRAEMCCNGFLTPGQCDLTNYQCLPRHDEPAVRCVNESIAEADAALLRKIDAHMCTNFTFDIRDYQPTPASTDDACGGVLFRQCQVGTGPSGICYNGRMQVVYCDAAGYYEQMRRLQIERRVGIPCDPVEEAWLGCKG